MLTNLETWKVVTGEPVEMETNNNVGPGEEANCLGVNTTSAVSTVSACVTNTHGVHAHGPPILSRQGSVDELITHCLSSETENMLTDPDLWQILSSEGTMDHAPSLEEAENVKVKRSLSSGKHPVVFFLQLSLLAPHGVRVSVLVSIGGGTQRFVGLSALCSAFGLSLSLSLCWQARCSSSEQAIFGFFPLSVFDVGKAALDHTGDSLH